MCELIFTVIFYLRQQTWSNAEYEIVWLKKENIGTILNIYRDQTDLHCEEKDISFDWLGNMIAGSKLRPTPYSFRSRMKC